MKTLLMIMGLLLVCSCASEGLMYTYSYEDNGKMYQFADSRKFTPVDSVYILPKKRSKQERFQNLVPELIAK